MTQEIASNRVERDLNPAEARPFEKDHLQLFLDETDQYPLLNASRERELGTLVQNGLRANDRLKELTEDDSSREQVVKAVQVGFLAKHEFVHANLRLIVGVARNYYTNHPRGKSYGLFDLYQEGYFGLDRAVEKFDPTKGFKFSTYATPWISHYIQRALQDKGTTVRVPTNRHDHGKKYRARINDGQTDAQIKVELGLSENELEAARHASNFVGHLVSLDKPIKEAEDLNLGAFIADPNPDQPFQRLFDLEKEAEDNGSEFEVVAEALIGVIANEEISILRKRYEASDVNVGLTPTEQRRKNRMKHTLEHPVVRHVLKEVLSRYIDEDSINTLMPEDWRDRANCIGRPELYTGKLRLGKEAEVQAICAQCPVRAQCSQYFAEHIPYSCRWIDGINQSKWKRAQTET